MGLKVFRSAKPFKRPPRILLARHFSLLCEYYRHAEGYSHSPYATVHYQMMQMMQEYHFASLILVPRNHMKTSIISVLAPIWFMLRDPSVRIRVVSASDELASRITAQIIHIIKAHFADLLPIKKALSTSLTLEGRRIQKEPTLTCSPISGSRITGSRNDILIFDDISTNENADTPKKRQFIKERFIGTLGTFSSREDIRTIVVGTTFYFDDLYADILQNKLVYDWRILRVPVLKKPIPFERPITVEQAKQIIEGGYLIWPAAFKQPSKLLAEYNNPSHWASQYMLTPQTEEMQPLRYVPAEDRGRPNPMDLKIVVASIDPASHDGNDDTALVVVGMTEDGTMHVLDGLATNSSDASHFASQWWAMMQGWRYGPGLTKWPITILESNAAWKIYGNILRMIAPLHYHPYIQQKSVHGKKEDRIRGALAGPLSQAKVLIHQSPIKEKLLQQIEEFPLGSHDDVVDALATAVLHLFPYQQAFRAESLSSRRRIV